MKMKSISSSILIEEAEQLGLKVKIVSKSKSLFYIKSNKKEILFKSTDFGINSSLGAKISDNKELSDSIFKKYGLPIADTWYLSKNKISTLNTYNFIFPVIIKPIEENHGNGVMMNIINIEELKEKLILSFKKYSRMIIQKQIEGEEYRLLVLMGKVILSINRIPASITGDGIKNIGDLIKYENKNNILRGKGYTNELAFIESDNELIDYIGKKGMNLESVPLIGEKVQLKGTSNIKTGGTMVDVSDMVSSDIKKLACKTAKILGLGIAGVDIITDITKPLKETGGIILEINDCPGLGGDRKLTNVNTGKVILETLFF